MPRVRASSSTAAASTAGCASARPSAPSSTPSGERARCATTRGRTCSIARCATSSGERARQAGSLVTPDGPAVRLPARARPSRADELRPIEAEVRRIIRDARTVTPSVMTMEEAIAAGADAFFDEKYGERVRTVRVDGYSHELCGGTHCSNTGQIGGFVITGERSIGTGQRRIEALTGDGADAWLAARRSPRSTRPPRRSAPSRSRRSRSGSRRSRSELRETKRRLKAGGGGGDPASGRARRDGGRGRAGRAPRRLRRAVRRRSTRSRPPPRTSAGCSRRASSPSPSTATSRSSSSRSATTSSPAGIAAGKLVQAAVGRPSTARAAAVRRWPRARARNGKASRPPSRRSRRALEASG